MSKKKKEQIALFRFGVISGLVHIHETEKGEREKRIRTITHAQWEIPCSNRCYISRSTVLEWLKKYQNSGNKLESLMPKERGDTGVIKSMDTDTQDALVNLKNEYPRASLPLLLKIARERKIIMHDFKASLPSVYRLFKSRGVLDQTVREDRRSFEAELVNDLWQADCMHGPYVEAAHKKRKTYLQAIVDDHSRLIVHAEFYLTDTTEAFLDTFEKAIRTRGLPRKVYVDNGPSYRSHRLRYVTASLGVALIHAKPYVPQGKGKIERWFKTVRMRFLPCVYDTLDSLASLNAQLHEWIEKDYHRAVHSSTKQRPIERYVNAVHMVRTVPENVKDYFRISLRRKVGLNRVVSVHKKWYEAPVHLIGKTVTLRFHEDTPEEIEVFHNDISCGYVHSVNQNVNYRLGREKSIKEDTSSHSHNDQHREKQREEYASGELFDTRTHEEGESV